MTPQAFIAAISGPAKTSMASTKIPASFVVADAALESAWGGSMLTQQAFNLFGVKADPSWTGPTISMNTREYLNGQWIVVPALWRKYADWLGSINDHAQFLLTNPRYQPAFAYTTGALFAKAIQAAGYATDPQYATKIIEIITAHNLGMLDVA